MRLNKTTYLKVCSVVLLKLGPKTLQKTSVELIWLQHVFDLLGGSLIVQMFGRIPVGGGGGGLVTIISSGQKTMTELSGKSQSVGNNSPQPLSVWFKWINHRGKQFLSHWPIHSGHFCSVCDVSWGGLQTWERWVVPPRCWGAAPSAPWCSLSSESDQKNTRDISFPLDLTMGGGHRIKTGTKSTSHQRDHMNDSLQPDAATAAGFLHWKLPADPGICWFSVFKI